MSQAHKTHSERSTRQRIIEAADRLFYQHGFEHTSFSDIADSVKLSRGNFYYHFKTKDEILQAVIDYRLDITKTLLKTWEHDSDSPRACICRFINILIMNRTKIKNFGCPVGTLCSELAKLDHAALPDANKLFTLFRGWLRKQFTQLDLRSKADTLAMHVLARSQGIATLANAFHDETFIRKEVRELERWLDSQISKIPTT